MDKIITQLTSPSTLVIAGGAILLLFLLMLLRKSAKQGGADGGDVRQRVREMVEGGDFRAAANLQKQNGNHKEAYNLLERGRLHMEAAKLAEGQGWFDRAAKGAMQAGQFEWAAELYMKAKDPAHSAKMFARIGKHLRAAEILEQVGTDDWPFVAQCWEKALLQMLPSNQDISKLGQEALRQIYMTAEKAASAYQRSGKPERSVLIYEACQQKEKAETIRRQIASGSLEGYTGTSAPGSNMDPLSVAAGNPQPLDGAATTTGGLGEQDLGLLSKVVDQAVNRVMGQTGAGGSQVIVNSPAMTGMGLEGTGIQITGPTNVNVINVPNLGGAVGSLASSTPIRAESERYSILDKIGEGGMAVVYKALDNNLDREVALKFLPEGVTQAAASYRLFEKEAKSAAGINHPNIITIYDFGTLDNRPFISMELLDGIAFDDLLQKLPHNRLPLNAFFQVFDELLSALDTAHGRGLVHRDVKPSNMMLTKQSIIKLMDFGIAKEINPEKSTMIAGTPYYMAPEQFSGKGIDHRVDLFAVGVTMYLCLTGKLPFEGFMRIEPPRPPSELWRIPSSLDKLVMWCITFEPEKRPESSYDLLQNLRRIRREVKRDPIFAPQLEPEGKNSFYTLLGAEFFESTEPRRDGSRRTGLERVNESSSTIASFQSSAELPSVTSRQDLPSAGQYSRPLIQTGHSRDNLPSASHYTADNIPAVNTHASPPRDHSGHYDESTRITPQRGQHHATAGQVPAGARPPQGPRRPAQPHGGGYRAPQARPPVRRSAPNIPVVRDHQAPPDSTMVSDAGEETMFDPNAYKPKK